MLEIIKMLTLSTAHISYDTATKLDAAVSHEQFESCTVYSKDNYGWFIYIDADAFAESKEDIPADLLACIELALAVDCAVLCLDADANDVDELPCYDWDE